MAETNNKLSGLNFASAAKVTMKLNHVTFQDSPDTSTSIKVTSQDSPDASVYISMKETEIPISDRDNPRPTARKSSIISISEMKLTYHRLAFAFGICCIVMLFMLPIIFYYVDGNSDVSDILPSRAIGIVNVSQSTFCNESMTLLCSDDLVYTYEALRLLSQRTFPHCINQVKNTLPELQNCSDMSCVEGIICQKIRQEYCTAEWRVLELNESEGLIDCSDYGETAPLNCSDQFGLDNNGSICQPLCETFSQFSETFITNFSIWHAVCSGLNVIGGIISLMISVYKIKKLFQYPQILIVVNSILISILSLFFLIAVLPRENWRPLCSRQFIFDALNEPNLFCGIIGFTYSSIISLYCYFWFLFILHLFLRISSPIRMGELEQSKHAKKAHIIEVICAVLLGTVPYFIFALRQEFRITTFPPLYCSGNAAHNFYGTILPTIVVSCASLIMMVITLYKIHVQKGLFRRKSYGSCRFCSINFSISEVKIFFTFCYLLIVLILQWTTFSLINARSDTINAAIRTYSLCLSGGIRKNLDCEPYRRELEAQIDTRLLTAYFTIFSFLSYSNLPFLVQFKTVQHFVVNTARRLINTRPCSRLKLNKKLSN